MRDELATLDATASAEMVRQGEVSPAELVEAAIPFPRISCKRDSTICPLLTYIPYFLRRSCKNAPLGPELVEARSQVEVEHPVQVATFSPHMSGM